MQVDKTTLKDLDIFTGNDNFSIFSHLDYTRTSGGKDWLHFFLSHPFSDIRDINETQQLLSAIIQVIQKWPSRINNGSIMVIEKFLDSQFDNLPASPNWLVAFFYKLNYRSDLSLVRYSVKHFMDFIFDLRDMTKILGDERFPEPVRKIVQKIITLLEQQDVFQEMLLEQRGGEISDTKYLKFAYLLLASKGDTADLIEIYQKLDAWRSLAYASKKYTYCFPVFVDGKEPYVRARALYHPLLIDPEPVNFDSTGGKKILFLTGANMAGKSTFIRSMGVSIYLAHIGMAVPADSMELSLFDGLLTNIQIEDDITRGESFFFNEVQRIKDTISKVMDGKKWFVLIDELFKGTNVYDAMKCSLTVIQGMNKLENINCVISTHLYEISESLKCYDSIQFCYFEVEIKDKELSFTYTLKEGVSNDRVGYLILERYGVLELLDRLQ